MRYLIFLNCRVAQKIGCGFVEFAMLLHRGFSLRRSAYHFSEKVLKVELWGLHKIPSANLLNLPCYCIDSAELCLVRSGHYVQTASAG